MLSAKQIATAALVSATLPFTTEAAGNVSLTGIKPYGAYRSNFQPYLGRFAKISGVSDGEPLAVSFGISAPTKTKTTLYIDGEEGKPVINNLWYNTTESNVADAENFFNFALWNSQGEADDVNVTATVCASGGCSSETGAYVFAPHPPGESALRGVQTENTAAIPAATPED